MAAGGSLRKLLLRQRLCRSQECQTVLWICIDEVRADPAPKGYLEYLRLKLRQAAAALPASVQKSTFSDDL
jgi:hypothetical protein